MMVQKIGIRNTVNRVNFEEEEKKEHVHKMQWLD